MDKDNIRGLGNCYDPEQSKKSSPETGIRVSALIDHINSKDPTDTDDYWSVFLEMQHITS